MNKNGALLMKKTKTIQERKKDLRRGFSYFRAFIYNFSFNHFSKFNLYEILCVQNVFIHQRKMKCECHFLLPIYI